MPLNQTQLTAFKAAIQADGAVAANVTAGNYGTVADYFNESSGAGFMWRPDVSAAEAAKAIVWSAFKAMTAVEQNTYLALVSGGTIDATNADVRAGFSSIFPAGTTRDNIVALAQKVPTRFEAVFNVANICSVFGQSVSAQDVADALQKG